MVSVDANANTMNNEWCARKWFESGAVDDDDQHVWKPQQLQDLKRTACAIAMIDERSKRGTSFAGRGETPVRDRPRRSHEEERSVISKRIKSHVRALEIKNKYNEDTKTAVEFLKNVQRNNHHRNEKIDLIIQQTVDGIVAHSPC